MTKTRWDYVQREHSETAATGTIAFDLPEKGFMPNLLMNIGITPTGNSAQVGAVTDHVTKVEILDGGLVIKSLTANQLKGLAMIHGHRQMGSTEINDASVAGYDNFIIPMGGFFNGKKYAPDMGQFSNPQMRITWDCSITTTEFGVTVTADTSPAMLISVLAEIASEGAQYSHGYLKSSIVKEFTQATSTNTYIEIPKGDNLVGIGIEAGYDALDFTEDVEEIKLDFNNGEWIPFHLREKEIMPFQQHIFKAPFQYSWMMDLESSEEIDTHMGFLLHLSAMGTPSATAHDMMNIFNYEKGNKGVETIRMFDATTPLACDVFKGIYLQSTGWAPFHIWYVPCSFLNGGENDLIDTSEFGRIEVEMKSGSSASTSSTPDLIVEFLKT